MKADLFVAVDAGTGGGKCMIIGAEGKRLAVHRLPWSYKVSTSAALPFVREFEFDAGEFWRILCTCIRAALADASIDPRRIAGVAATSQREGCVFLNTEGQEIYAGPNLDSRGFAEGVTIMNTLGPQRLYEITGHSAPFIFPLARYLWHRTARSERVGRILMISDWLTYRLSGAQVAEPSNATESMLFDLRARTWSQEILKAFDIPADVLPELHPSGARVGAITAVAAAETGLIEGTPVFAGGADTQCSLLGAGVIAPGEVGATLGTTTPIQMVVEHPTFDPEFNLWSGCHVIADRWVIESNAGDTGDAYLWLLNLVGGEAHPERLFLLGEELARKEGPSEVFSFLGPTIFNMVNPRHDKPGGILFPFPMLHHRPDHGAMVRSFLDSIAFAIRANCEQIAAVTASAPKQLTLSGGLARSNALVRRVAAIMGMPIILTHEPESAALGCAILAAAGSGVHPSVHAAADAMVHLQTVDPPDGLHAAYEPAYEKWRELYGKLDAMPLG